MGNSTSFQPTYAVAVEPPASESRSALYRAATHPDALVTTFVGSNIQSGWDLFLRGLKLNPNGRFLGRRIVKSDNTLGRYVWVTYKRVEEWAIQLGSALCERDLCPAMKFPEERHGPAQSMRLVGIFAKNRIEWFVTEQACNAFGITLVPLYDTLGEEAMAYILEQTGLCTAFCSLECLPSLLKSCSKSGGKLKNLICYDKYPDTLSADLKKEYDITLHSYDDLLNCKNVLTPAPAVGETIATLCYTSGTTGNPKGVLISQANFTAVVCAAVRGPLANGMDILSSDTHISYLPLPHVFERAICNIVIAAGASIGVYSGDTLKLLDDVRELQPTVFISVPRLFNRINDKVFGGIKEKSAVAQYLFNSGMSTKLKNLREDATVVHGLWDNLVFKKISQLMGGRLRYMVAGGAPLDALIEERMKVLFCCPLTEGYGLTETLGASFITNPKDPLSGHVGGVLPCLEFVLESVPETDYFVNGEECRGELLVRGHGLCKGYFKNPEEWEKAVDKDGWFHTGDIVVLLPNKGIKIIDRKKNIFKLAQGEYVAPEKIEAVYQQAGLVGQLFAFGYSSKTMLVGIVIPDADMSAKWAAKAKLKDTSLKALCADASFKAAVAADLEVAAKSGGLKGFEKIKEFTLWHEPFSTENGLLTPTFKLKRHQAKQEFQKQIDAMYEKLGC